MHFQHLLPTVLLLICFPAAWSADDVTPLKRPGPKILFLGDSITAAGHYVDDIETCLLLHDRKNLPTIVALGLGSETVSGLTEPVHPFPRPNVHARLERVLKRIKPDLVVACYGMNDGIYHPFSAGRFAAFQQGILTLIEKSHAIGAKVTLLTPTPWAGSVIKVSGPAPGQPYGFQTPFADYNDVLRQYADWVLSLSGKENVDTIDVRTPMLLHLKKSYTSRDPIHPNRFGHELMAEAILGDWGYETGNEIIRTGVSGRSDDKKWREVRKLVAARRSIFDKALLWDIGHDRPGKPLKITLAEAQRRAATIDRQIAEVASPVSFRVSVRSVRRVFYNGEHNAFTDLVRFHGRMFLTFRSCPDGHMVHPTSSIIVMTSDDGSGWRQVHRFSVPKRDTRDPHFLVFNDQLFVFTGTWYCGASSPERYDLNQHLGYGVVTTDGDRWTDPFQLEGTYGHYVWRAASHGETAYLCGRRKRGFAETNSRAERDPLVESALLESQDGRNWKHRGLFQNEFGDETAFLFVPDGSAMAVARTGGRRNAQLCRAQPPYISWTRIELDRYIGGPLLAKWGDRYVVGGRQTNDQPARMSLYWLVGEQLQEFVSLPSGGDCSYPGFLELEDGSALVSYYSSHEQSDDRQPITAIYLAHLTK